MKLRVATVVLATSLLTACSTVDVDNEGVQSDGELCALANNAVFESPSSEVIRSSRAELAVRGIDYRAYDCAVYSMTTAEYNAFWLNASAQCVPVADAVGNKVLKEKANAVMGEAIRGSVNMTQYELDREIYQADMAVQRKLMKSYQVNAPMERIFADELTRCKTMLPKFVIR